MVISGGILTPPDRRPVEERKVPVTAAKIYEQVDILREKGGVPVLVPKQARPGEVKKAIAAGNPAKKQMSGLTKKAAGNRKKKKDRR